MSIKLITLVFATLIFSTTSNADIVNTGSSAPGIYEFNWEGVFTMQSSAGELVQAFDSANSWDGYRIDVDGTYLLDTNTGVGTMTIDPFLLLNEYFTVSNANTVTLSPSQMVGNFIYDWFGNAGLNMDIVWDVTGLTDALAMGMSVGDSISGNQGGTIGSALPASNSVAVGPNSYLIGPAPMATSAFDLVAGGIVPIADGSGIGGSPQASGPFTGANFNLDIGNGNSMHLISITPAIVPIPASVWLFGSGLIGLAGLARRKRA